MNGVIIRDAQIEDARAIREVYYHTWLATYPNEQYGITKDDIEDRFKDTFSGYSIQRGEKSIRDVKANERSLVATTGGRIVGVSNILKGMNNSMRTLYVSPEYQRKGIGRMIFEEARRWFDPAQDIIVDVAVYNAGAIAFYESIGFIPTGDIFTEEQFKMKSGVIIPELRMINKHK